MNETRYGAPEKAWVIPAVIIGLGEFGTEIVRRTRAEIGQVHEDLLSVIRFVTIHSPGPGEMAVVDGGGETLYTSSAELAQPHDSRQAWFEFFKAHQADVRMVLRRYFQAVTVHEILDMVERAGFGHPEDERLVVIRVYVVGSLVEKFVSGIFLPVTHLIHDLAYRKQEEKTFYLVAICHIALPQGVEDDLHLGASLFAAMAELDHFMGGDDIRSLPVDGLATGLRNPEVLGERAFDFCYLADRVKEDRSLARDDEEIITALSSALQVLLLSTEAETRTHLRQMAWREQAGWIAPYNSIGAASFVTIEPEIPRNWCASQLAADFIEEEYLTLSEARKAMAEAEAARLLDETEQRLNVARGKEELRREVPLDVVEEKKKRESLVEFMIRLVGGGRPRRKPGLRLRIRWPRFGEMNYRDWARKIADYDAILGRRYVPRYTKQIEDNAQAFQAELISEEPSSDGNLPQGFLPQKVHERIARSPIDLYLVQRYLARVRDDLVEQMEKNLVSTPISIPREDKWAREDLQRSLHKKIPIDWAIVAKMALLLFPLVRVVVELLGLLPPFARGVPFSSVFFLIFLALSPFYVFLRVQSLVAKREYYLQTIAHKYGQVLHRGIVDQLHQVLSEVRRWTDNRSKETREAERKFRNVVSILRGSSLEDIERYLVEEPVVHQAIYKDYYQKQREKGFEGVNQQLVDSRLLDDWLHLPAEEIADRLRSWFATRLKDMPTLTIDEALEQLKTTPWASLRDIWKRAVPMLRSSFPSERLPQAILALPWTVVPAGHRGAEAPSVLLQHADAVPGTLLVPTGNSQRVTLVKYRPDLPFHTLSRLEELRRLYDRLDAQGQAQVHLDGRWAEALWS